MPRLPPVTSLPPQCSSVNRELVAQAEAQDQSETRRLGTHFNDPVHGQQEG